VANNTKMNISYSIKAVDRFSRVHDRLERQLSRISAMADGATVDREINIDVDNANAQRQLQATNAAVERLPLTRRIRIFLDEVGGDHQRRLDKLATKLRNVDEIMMQMAQGLIWMLIPALGPMLGAAAGGAGALAAELIGAGAAFGAFSMVAIPAVSYLKEMDEEVKRGSDQWNNLSEATRGSLSALDTLRSTWGKMQDTFREPTLEVFALALEGANTGLKLLLPTVESSVGAMKNLAKAFNANLAAEDVKGIFEWLGSTGGTYLEKFTKTLGNFFVGFMNMMVAFDPLTQDFADGFLRMSEKFREWSSTLENNKAFQDFLKYTAEQGPVVLSFLGNLIKFLVELGVAMAPVGELVLEYASKFLAWAAAGLKNNEWLGKLIGILLLVRSAMSVIGPILVVVRTAFNLLWPIITTVWKWFGKLQGVIMRIMPWVVRVGATILRLSNPIGIIISIVGLLATVIISNWDTIWAWTKKTFAKIADWIIEKWKQVKAFWSVLGELVNVLKTKFGEMVTAVFEKMTEIYKDIKSKWEDVKSFLSGLSLKSIGANIIQGLINGITSIDVKGAVEGVASKIKDGFLGFFNIHSPSRLMKKDVGRWITLGVLDGMTSMQSKAEREAERVANAIKRPFDTMSTDYAFSASGTAVARQSYENARTSRYQTSATSEGSTSPETKQPGVQYAVVNIGGYEAKGAIEYITQEQARAKSRKERFKG
jgi:hypothetical protein